MLYWMVITRVSTCALVWFQIRFLTDKHSIQCTEDELNRRERRRASNRKAAQSARDRRVKKQEQLETQIDQYHTERKRFEDQRKQWEETESNYKQQVDQQASELREAKDTISSLQHELFNVKKQQSPLQLLNSPW